MGDLSAKNVDCESLTFRTYSVRRKQSSGQTSEKEREGRERGAGGEQRMTKLPKESLEDSRRYEKEFVQICSGTKKKRKKRFRCACFSREIYVDWIGSCATRRLPNKSAV